MIKAQSVPEKQVESVWRAYHAQLLSFIASRVKDKEIAEDILQNVFIKILENIDSLKDMSKMKSWMYRIARNAIIDYYRAGKPNDSTSVVHETESAEKAGNENEIVISWLLPVIDSLPEKYRQAVLLCDIQGMSQKDFATHTGISYAGAKSRVQRGRAMLREKLTQCCHFLVDTYGNILGYSGKKSCDNC